MLKNLILSAAAAALAAGLVTAALQHATTTPLIVAAERYEHGAAPEHALPAAPDVMIGTHDGEHANETEWTPADGVERTLYTSIATVVTGFGFALALLGAMVLSGRSIDGPTGLAFGAAGFAAVALAPALGLPPQIPGSAAADLLDRQVWWGLTVVASAAGLFALLLARMVSFRIGGLILLAAPHIVGAPQPPGFQSTAPAELASQFAAASLVIAAVFWAVLGLAAGGAYRRLAPTGPRS